MASTERSVAYVVYNDAVPTLFIVADNVAHAERLIADNAADIPREKLRLVPALEAKLEDVQRLVAILQGQFLMVQFSMLRQASGPIKLVGRQ